MKDKWRWWLLAIQSAYYGVTGVWPIVHMPSFEAVTGPKIDDWLVHMVGLLAAAIGVVLGAATMRNRIRSPEVALLAATSAAAFAAIDIWYGLTGRISPIYLADAGVQIGLIGGLLFTPEDEAGAVDVMGTPALRMYHDLARWWPLLSPPSEYDEEAADLLGRLPRGSGSRPLTMLELGSGGGSLAAHLKHHYQLTLTDLSAGMLAVSRTVNPECEHLEGDMRSLRLGRRFDVVLVHDAIMYAVGPADVQATLLTAAVHCQVGGMVAVLPDYVRETFIPGTACDGHDAADGRGLRYLEWRWDPDPADNTYVVEYAFLLRESDGSVIVEHDRHMEGLFPRADWLVWFEEAGLTPRTARDSSGREIFLGTPRAL